MACWCDGSVGTAAFTECFVIANINIECFTTIQQAHFQQFLWSKKIDQDLL